MTLWRTIWRNAHYITKWAHYAYFRLLPTMTPDTKWNSSKFLWLTTVGRYFQEKHCGKRDCAPLQKFHMISHVWNFTCEFGTCDFSHVKFHMWVMCFTCSKFTCETQNSRLFAEYESTIMAKMLVSRQTTFCATQLKCTYNLNSSNISFLRTFEIIYCNLFWRFSFAHFVSEIGLLQFYWYANVRNLRHIWIMTDQGM